MYLARFDKLVTIFGVDGRNLVLITLKVVAVKRVI